jgi:hypothetical protein
MELKILFIAVFVTTTLFRFQYLWLGQAAISFPFYHIGKRYHRHIIAMNQGKGLVKISRMLICACLVSGLALYNGKVSMMTIWWGNFPYPLNVASFYIGALAGSMLVLDISSYYTCPIHLVNTIATSLLSVVGFQKLYLKPFIDTFGYNHNIILSVFIALLIILMCVWMHLASVKLFPWIFGHKKPATRN